MAFKWFKAESAHAGLAVTFRQEWGIKGLGYWYLIQQMMQDTDTDEPNADIIRYWTGCNTPTSKRIETILNEFKRVQTNLNESKRVQTRFVGSESHVAVSKIDKTEKNRENRDNPPISPQGGSVRVDEFFDKNFENCTIKPKKERQTAKKQDYSVDFEQWWALYPEKGPKQQTYANYRRVVDSEGLTHSQLMEVLKAYIAYVTVVNSLRVNGEPRPWQESTSFLGRIKAGYKVDWTERLESFQKSARPEKQKLPDRSQFTNSLAALKQARSERGTDFKHDWGRLTPAESG